MNKNGLLVRLAIVIAFSSLAVSFISAQVFYRQTYLNEIKIAHQEIEQLFRTVQATAAISAYLEDKELAKEVVNGLKTNDLVLNASIKTHNGVSLTAPFSQDIESNSFTLMSPFIEDTTVGKLEIASNIDYIAQRAERIGARNSLALVLQALVVTIVAIYIAYSLITKPMIRSARRLHGIEPGTKDRLPIPDFHDQSELGGLVRDINKLLEKTEQQIKDERTLRNNIEVLEKRFRMLFENSTSPIVLMEPLGNILLYNDAFHAMLDKLGIHFKKNYGPLLSELFEAPEQLNKSIQKAFTNDEIATGEFQLRLPKDIDSCWVQVVANEIVSDDMKEYYQITLQDISSRRQELEALNMQAHSDQLTQLLNRHALEQHLEQMTHQKVPFALMMMDLNGFKQVNDVYGHDAGDELLVHLAGVLKKSVRKDDLCGRWGGDEFVLVFKNITREPLEKLTAELIRKIKRPFFLSGFDKEVSVGASIGVAFYPEHDVSIQALIQKADQAMYSVKRRKELPNAPYLLICGDELVVSDDQVLDDDTQSEQATS